MASARIYRKLRRAQLGSLATVAWVAGTIAGAGACASLGAPGAVSPDRPGYTDTPPVLPARGVELEAGVTDDHQTDVEYVSIGETLLRFGVGARTEIRLFGNSYAVRHASGAPDVSGMEDAKIGAKVNLRARPDSEHSWLPNAAILVATTLPTGASGIGARAAQPEAKLAVNWTTPSPFSLYANFGYGSIENESGHATREWTSVAGWWAVNSKVSAMVEGLTIGRMSGSGSGTAGNVVDVALTYLVTDRFQIDVRAGRGVGSELASERFIGIGLARRW